MPTNLLNSTLEATRLAELERLTQLPPWEALADWLGLASGDPPPDRRVLIARLSRGITAIDARLSAQLDRVLHDSKFQALEACWRGVVRLVEQVENDDDNVIVRLLDVTWGELVRDLDRAIEFDQSQLFLKVYSAEFGSPGGRPFGVLIGNYAMRHRRSREHLEDDLGALRSISEIAAAAFAPFITGAHPSLFGLDNFGQLERPIDLARSFTGAEYAAWNNLRKLDDVRFVGLTLPRVLMRLPYREDPARADGFRYREDASALDGSGYLFGTAAWAFGEVLIRTFIENGWMASIRGVERGSDSGGLVTGSISDWFQTDRPGLVPKGSLEVQLTSDQERELSNLGFIPLTHCPGTHLAAFYSNQSIQAWADPTRTARTAPTAEMNAKLSSMLQYVFCVSRFAHYVKVIARDKVGSFARPGDLENELNNWLVQYTTSNESLSADVHAKYPLREGHVEVREAPGHHGVYLGVVHLRPHYQLDQMTSAVKLVTELFAGRNS